MSFQERINNSYERHADLIHTLAETGNAEDELKEQGLLIKEMQEQIKRNEEKLKLLKLKRVSEMTEHIDIRDSNVRRFMYKASGQATKFDAKARKEEEEYYDVLQEQQDTISLNETLKVQVEEAKKREAELEVAAAISKQARKELNALYDAVFTGNTLNFPSEDTLERRYDKAMLKYYGAKLRFDDENKRVFMLKQARIKIERSKTVLKKANRPGFIEDYNITNKATAAYKEACNLADYVGLKDVPGVDSNLYSSPPVLFLKDGPWGRKCLAAQDDLTKLDSVLAETIDAGIVSLREVKKDMKDAEAASERAHQALQTERARCFEQMVREQGDQLPPPIESGPPDSESCPAYEA